MSTTMKTLTLLLTTAALSGFVLAGCGDDDGTVADGGPMTDGHVPDTDSGPTPDGGPVPTGPCTDLCNELATNCTGANAQYASTDECMAYCTGAGWPEGTAGEMAGNTISCRIYHGGAPAMMDPATHCPHAGPSGAGVCGGPDFRTESADMYTRVDRMGMPAVSTALVSSGMKNAYNDADPTDDVAGTFAGDLITNLTGLHTALDDDLTGAGLTPCSMTNTIAGLPACLGQDVAAGVHVADLVLPDTLQVNPAAAAGFPNGRKLTDPVIDVTLSVVMLELTSGTCGGSPCGPTTLVGTNPSMNDVPFLTEFPYLAPPHTP